MLERESGILRGFLPTFLTDQEVYPKSQEVQDKGGVGMILVNVTSSSEDADNHVVPTVHVNAPKSLELKSRLEANPEKLWSLSEMERTGGEPDVLGQDRRPASTVFMIVRPKVPKAAEVFVTTARHWKKEKSTSRKITHWIWPLTWVSSF